jgi:hypothetical protein
MRCMSSPSNRPASSKTTICARKVPAELSGIVGSYHCRLRLSIGRARRFQLKLADSKLRRR